jgi:hypothetical protein
MLKAYNDNNSLIAVITNFFMEKGNSKLMRDLRETFKKEEVRNEFSAKVSFRNKIADTIKEELLKSPNIFKKIYQECLRYYYMMKIEFDLDS